MSDFETSDIGKEFERSSIPQVKEVSQLEYKELESKYPNRIEIEMESHLDFDESDTPIENAGADPCFIVWEYNSETNQMVRTGHYPEVSSRRQERISREYLANQIDEDSEDLISDLSIDTSMGFNDFLEFSEKASDDIKTSGQENIHLYFFGQNSEFKANPVKRHQKIVDNAIEQNDVEMHFRNIGVSEGNIHDYRKISNTGTDNTIYIPEENTIYYYHQEGLK